MISTQRLRLRAQSAGVSRTPSCTSCGPKKHRVAAELGHADFEGHASAQARLLEDHRQAAARQQRVGDAAL